MSGKELKLLGQLVVRKEVSRDGERYSVGFSGSSGYYSLGYFASIPDDLLKELEEA